MTKNTRQINLTGIFCIQSAYEKKKNDQNCCSICKEKLKKRKVELGETDNEMYTTEIKSGLSKDDYIAWVDDSYKEGMKTTTEYQMETDGETYAS